MAVSSEAIQYAVALIKQGRLHLGELCKVMALYGAEAGELGDRGHHALIDRLVAEVLRGDHPTDYEGTVGGAALFTDEESWHDVDELTGQGTDQDPPLGPDNAAISHGAKAVGAAGGAVSGASGAGGGLQENSTDLGEPKPQLHRRIQLNRPVGTDATGRSVLTALGRFWTQNAVEPTVNPGLDANGPSLDDPGTEAFAMGQEIGKGGAGHVLHGVDRDLRRSVAVKLLHDKHRNNPLLLRAFFEEAIITGGLEHPNIVPVYHMGYTDDLGPYYVMKLLDGITLGAALQGLRRRDPEMEARFDLDRLLTIFIEVCQAMLYAHDRGVIHCDLKPNNILIGHYGEVMVVDWGLAFVMGDSGALQARSQFWSGTPGFMAPEQVIGDVSRYDQRTDVWALGGLLYAMLCLSRPFVGRDKQETLQQVMHGELIPPSKRNPSRRVPEALEKIVAKAMAKGKPERYASANELMSDVENLLAGRRRLRQRVELGQKALSQMREHLDALSATEAVVDALQRKLLASGVTRGQSGNWRRDLQDLRLPLALAYREAARVGIEAVEAGAHHPALESLLGDLYWRVFDRLYPARVPTNRQVQRLASEVLNQAGETVLGAVVRHGRKLSGMGEEAPSMPTEKTEANVDPWLEAVLAHCGPDAKGDGASGVAARLGRRLSFLKDVALFSDITGMELLPIAEACERRAFKHNTAIFNEGDFGDTLYIVVDGLINIVRGGAVINTIGSTAVLGEIAIIDGATRTAGAVCATEVSVYALSAERFRSVVRDNGTIGLSVMKVLTARLREATAREEALRALK